MTRRQTRRAVVRGGVAGGLAGGLVLAGLGGGSASAAGRPAESRGASPAGSRGRRGAAGAGAEVYVPVAVGAGGGPVGSDRVHVLKVGPRDAETVVVLVPGMFGAAGDFRLMARDLVASVPGVQVWALDRREENLADRTGFTGTAPDPVGYYLDGRYRALEPASAGYLGRWGLERALDDLRCVVLAARAGGRRRVVLGGHSWGATSALAYAAWDFDGRPGYRDLAGLAVLDGGVRGAFEGTGTPVRDSPEEVRERLAAIAGGQVLDMTLSGVGLGARAESTQIWYQLAGWYAHHDPHGRSVLQDRVPEALRVPFPVTNAALLGSFVDAGFGWPNDISVHSGHLAPAGDDGGVRGWADDGITPIGRVARAYAGPVPGVWEWYWPARLSVDLDVSDAYADTDLARSLGLRLRHAAGLDIPLYAFQTSYSKGTVVESARRVVAESRVPYAAYASDEGMNHLDPLFAATPHNTATRTLGEFVGRVTGRERARAVR